MLNRFFRRKGAQTTDRYAKAAGRFDPSEDLDPCTLELVRFARDQLLVRYEQGSSIVESDDPIKLWQNEIFRLLLDGFLLGRIEDNNEGKHLIFDQLEGGGLLETVEFALIADGAITVGVQSGYFSSRPTSDTAELLRSFVLQASRSLFDKATNSRLMGEALGRAVNMGRQIALLEGYYFVPAKRDELNKIRATLSEDEKRAMQSLVETISKGATNETRDRTVAIVDYLRSQRG